MNLNEAYKKATTHVFETPKTQTNVFKQWMIDISLWRMFSGLQLDDSMVDLPVSPHYWNPKTLECYAVRRGQDCGWFVKRCL